MSSTWVLLHIQDVQGSLPIWFFRVTPERKYRHVDVGCLRVVLIHTSTLPEPLTLLLKLVVRSWSRQHVGFNTESGDTLTCLSQWMSARSRADSVEPLMDRPDFRSKLVRDLIPEPPDYLSAHQKRHWRQQKWNELFGKQENLQVGAPVQATTPQPKAKARAAAYFGGGGIRRVRSSVRSRLWQWLWRCCGGSVVTLVAILLLAVYGGAEGPLIQVGRLLGIAADLGEATSVAAGQAVNVTGAIAHAATDVITSATSNGLNSAENIWRGIDISQLVAHRCAGIMTMDDEHVLANWLNSSASSVLVPCMEKPDVGSRSLRVAFTYIIANFIRDLGAYNFI